MNFLTDSQVEAHVSKAIAISGSARSGTTIMGRLIHSLKEVEYSFEPMLLMRLFLLLGHMPEEAWKILYQTCLYDNILIDSIAGRSLNFNSNDDSYIFAAKSLREVAVRFERSDNRYKDLVGKANDRAIAYKLPDIVAMMPKLKKLYPSTRMLVMLRSPDAVVLSMKRKGWFRRDLPLYGESGLLKKIGVSTVPAIVEDANLPRWMEVGETDRCYMFYCQAYRDLPKVKDALVVDYDRFVEAPQRIFGEILDRFSLEYGDNTLHILDDVGERHSEYPMPEGADPELRKQAWRLYEELQTLSI